ncbi:FAD dependent oxidoreductase [Xylariales sp. PMI_506]|nr:FAD dependent oxidoreductase [Xylariales sp. PMI_506]
MSEVFHGQEEPLRIVIVGGGVIGCTTAYYLTRHPVYSPSRVSITLLEATRLASGASGKAGGLLAQWAYPSNLVPLSFDLHQNLATEHHGADAWGYRTISCGKLTARDRGLGAEAQHEPNFLSWTQQKIASWIPLGKRRDLETNTETTTATDIPHNLDWFDRKAIQQYEDIAPLQETAQVHPYHFTLAMANLAQERGAKVIVGAVAEEVEYGSQDSEADAKDHEELQPALASKVVAVNYLDKETSKITRLAADIVILAAGPWTPDLLPSLPMNTMRAHSVTLKPKRSEALPGYCLFTEITVPLKASTSSSYDDDEQHWHSAPDSAERAVRPEIYSRPDNEVYVAGECDTRVPLPPSTDQVKVDQDACRLLEEAVGGISDDLREAAVTSRKACYLPTVDSPSGNPLIGLTWTHGLLLATGHSCWGIQNAPGTGKLISEIVFEGEPKSADISSLDPRKYI